MLGQAQRTAAEMRLFPLKSGPDLAARGAGPYIAIRPRAGQLVAEDGLRLLL